MSAYDTDLSSRTAVTLVANREIITRVRSKAFVISTALMLVGIIAVVVISTLVRGSTSTRHVGFLPSQTADAAAFQAAAKAVGQRVTTPTIADAAEGEKELKSGKLDALVTGTSAGVQIEVKKELATSLRNAFTVLSRQAALEQQLRANGVDPKAFASAVGAAKVSVHSLETPDPNRGQRLAVGTIAGILVYLVLLIYGQAVAQGVVEEKTSRIVELLLSTIRPWQLMLGKVIGIGLIGLGQLVVVGVVGLVAAVGTNTLNLPGSVVIGAALTAFGWFLLGFLLYALMFAALGALVSRQEDVGGAVAPLTMLIVFPYILGISIIPSNPDSTLIAVLSLVPLFSPTLMPMRIATGVPGWEMALAVGLTLALIAAMVWLAGRIYGNAVTRTGARVRLVDALRPI